MAGPQDWGAEPVATVAGPAAWGAEPSTPEPAAGTPTWSEVPRKMIENAPASAAQFGHDLIQPFLHPIDTATSIKNLGHGALQKAGLMSGDEHIPYADAVGQFFADRYGGMDNLKKTLAEDPVGFAADLSTVLTGGGTLAARAPGTVGRVAKITADVGRTVDPLSAVTGTAKLAGNATAHLVGDLGTHTGAESLRQAAAAGYEGGEAAKAFRENLRGSAPMEDAVNDARKAVLSIRKQRGAAYERGMDKIRADTAVLDFDKVDDALADVTAIKTFKGQNISPKTQAIREEIAQEIQRWKSFDPAEFHTPEGLDALKQLIGDIRDGTEYGTPARVVADRAYHAIRQTIVDQAPDYAKVMKGYEEASKQLKEIERTLSINPNASVDTALRKLQSVLRNNVNTNFGRRKELADYLVNAGAPHLMKKLAGQSLSSWTPRGLGKAVASAAGVGGVGAAIAGLASPSVLGGLALMSPRLMGEGAYYAGRAASPLKRVPGRPLARASVQAGRLNSRPELENPYTVPGSPFAP